MIGAAGQELDLARMVDRFARGLVVREQFEGLRLVLGHRRHGLVGIGNVCAFGDAAPDEENAPGRGGNTGVLDR